MSPENQIEPAHDQPAGLQAPEAQNRSGRSGRGRRGRGRGRGRPRPAEPPGQPVPGPDSQGSREGEIGVAAEPEPVRFEELAAAGEASDLGGEVPFPEVAQTPEYPEPPPGGEPQKGPPASVQHAIDQVNDITENLRRSLDDMEEVLELLESLERQTNADEHELESLRRALRQLHRSPEKPPHHRGRH